MSKPLLKEDFLNCNDISGRSLKYGIETKHSCWKTPQKPESTPAVSPANCLHCILLQRPPTLQRRMRKGQEWRVQALHAERKRWVKALSYCREWTIWLAPRSCQYIGKKREYIQTPEETLASSQSVHTIGLLLMVSKHSALKLLSIYIHCVLIGF